MEKTPDAWVEMPSREDLQSLGNAGPYGFGFVPAMGRLLLAHPDIGPTFIQLFAQIMFAPGSLQRREREMVAAVTAAAQDCFY